MVEHLCRSRYTEVDFCEGLGVVLGEVSQLLLLLVGQILFNHIRIYYKRFYHKELIMVQWLTTLTFTYIGASLFFFLFPTLLHRRKSLKNPLLQQALTQHKILRIAHRGGPRYSTENTIQAFTHVEKVSDCIEMDVCETGDKVLVVHHDHHLKRTCGIDRDIQEFRFLDLPCFMDEIVLDFGYRLKVKSKKEKIPKLDDVFRKFPNMMMNIELKTPTDTAMVEFVRLLHEHNRVHNTIIGIRNQRNLELKSKNPQIMNFMNDKKVFTLAIAYLLGFAPFLRIEESSLQIPVYSKQFQDWNLDRTADKDKWKVKLFMRFVKLINFITRPLLWHLQKRGIICLGWVCNTKQAFDNAVKSGFHGIMTDDSFALDQYLKQRNLSIEQ